MWGATAFAGAWVAGSIGRWMASAIVAALVLAALAFNVSMLPYTLWFKGVMPMAVIASLALGAWVACKERGAAAFRSMRQHYKPLLTCFICNSCSNGTQSGQLVFSNRVIEIY
jgi:hypothetical protein